MNVLWVSNFTVQSAYAFQSRMAVERMPGHTVQVLDIRNGGSGSVQVGNTTILPTVHDPLGNDIIPHHAQRTKADVVITLCDVWGFQPDVMSKVNWWPVTPVDHTPIPPGCANSLKAAKGVMALSRFGQAELKRIGLDSMYVPHGLDGRIWKPALTRAEMNSARDQLHIPHDKYLISFVGVNDSNPSRKGIPELLAAYSMLQPKHSDWLLYLHTTNKGNIPLAGPKNGVDIDTLITTFDINPKSMLMPDEYRLRTGIPSSELANVARASDVFILPSRGEGFGVPLIEFQHAGTPVITTDFGGGAELCASGWLIDGEMEWSWQNATVLRPGIASIGERLEQAYAERNNLARRSEAHQFARDFEIDYVVSKYLNPALEKIAQQTVLNQKVAA